MIKFHDTQKGQISFTPKLISNCAGFILLTMFNLTVSANILSAFYSKHVLPSRMVISAGTLSCTLKQVSGSLALLSALLLCGELKGETGVATRRLKLGSYQPLSGPMRPYSAVGRGASVYFQYVNDQGGVHGRRIDLLLRDDRMQPERTKQVVQDLVMHEQVFALFAGIGTETTRNIIPMLQSQKTPSFFIGSNALEWSKPTRKEIFALLPDAETEARVLGLFIAARHPGEKVIVWFKDLPEFRNAAETLVRFLRNHSVKFLPSKPTSNRPLAEWKAIMDAGPRLVVALGPYSPLLKFLRNSASQGPPIYSGNSLADSTLTRLLSTGSLKRLRLLTAFPLLMERKHPGILLHRALMKEYAPGQIPGRWTVYGHAVAELMTAVLQKAGRSITRAGAINAAESLKNWRGALMPPVHLSSENHLALSFLKVSSILHGQVVHHSGWIDGRRNYE